jgi:hypothetical protein
MNSHADKTQENESQSVANAISQKQSVGKSAFQFVDNRPEAIAQRKLNEMVNNSPQAKQAAQLRAMSDSYTSQQEQPIQKIKNKTGLTDNLKEGIENLSGYSMDDVKVHYNSDKPAQLQAHAYAQGTDIHLAPGQEKHLPHEAWHVVQQRQGRVKPTIQLKGGVNVNDDASLENEVNLMGATAFRFVDHRPEAIAQRILQKTVGNNMIVSQLMENGEKDLETQKSKLEQDKAAIDQVSMEEFRKNLEKKIRDFAKTEYEYWGIGDSYTPYYKDNKVPAWKRVAYRMCEDRRSNDEPGHVKVTKEQLEQNLNNQCEQERNRRIREQQKINISLRDIVQR